MAKLSYKQVYNYIKSTGCELLSEEYINNRQKLNIRCSCGKEFKRTWHEFNAKGAKHMCIDCIKKWQSELYRLSENEAFKRINEQAKRHNYKFKGTYENASSVIECECLVPGCNKKWKTKAQHLWNGSGCPRCSEVEKRTHEEAVNIINNQFNNEYEVLSTYETAHSDLLVKHKCGYEYTTSYNKLVNNRNICPDCNPKLNSKLVIAIKDYIKQFNSEWYYKVEYRFSDCRGEKFPLPFDIALFNKEDNSLIALIEADGEQHFIPNSFGRKNADEAFATIIKNDAIKEDYCEDKNIKLIRISYKEINNVNEIMERELR